MEKKNRLSTIKCFEEFKADNEMYYTETLNSLKEILAYLTTHDVINNTINDWTIEGVDALKDVNEMSPEVTDELMLHNVNTSTDMDITFSRFLANDDIETEIESIVLWKNEGETDYGIRIDNEISTIVEEILEKIIK